MKTRAQEFEGWMYDVQAQAAHQPQTVAKVSGRLAVMGFGASFALFLVSDILPFATIQVSMVLLAAGATAGLVQEIARRRSVSDKQACRCCGKPMKLVETLPDAQVNGGEDLVFKPSGHAYRLVNMKGGLVKAFEVRLQWQACEPCRRYFSTGTEHLIDLGLGMEAIDDQEVVYRRNANTIAHLKATGFGRRASRQVMQNRAVRPSTPSSPPKSV